MNKQSLSLIYLLFLVGSVFTQTDFNFGLGNLNPSVFGDGSIITTTDNTEELTSLENATVDLFGGFDLSNIPGATTGAGTNSATGSSQIQVSVPLQPLRDHNCAVFNPEDDITCVKCSFRYYFNSLRRCTKVSDQCKAWSQTTGKCLTCYQGWRLYLGQCITGIPNCNKYYLTSCVQCQNTFILDNNRCLKETTSTTTSTTSNTGDKTEVIANKPKDQFLIQSVSAADNAANIGTDGKNQTRTVAIINQLRNIHPITSVKCYNISYVNWVYKPEDVCGISQCSTDLDKCSLNVAVRTVGQLQGKHYYWAADAVEQIIGNNVKYFSWPSTNYPYQYSAPNNDKGNDIFQAIKHCDGTWTFIIKHKIVSKSAINPQIQLVQEKSFYLSGQDLYRSTTSPLRCSEKWKLIKSRDGNGFFLQNVYTRGWLAFNGCKWHMSFHWRSKVILEIW